jgi:hypothetical protein
VFAAVVLFAAAATAATAACGNDLSPLPPSPPVVRDDAALIPSRSAPAGVASFRSLYEHVIARSCALPTCHGGAFEPYLGSAVGAYDSLVNAPAVGKPRTYRVRPGEPEASYLIERLTQDAPLPRMPFNLRELPDATIELFRRWIRSGAFFDDEGPVPALPNFFPERPEVFVYRGAERIDEAGPARVRVAEEFALWSTPRDFESVESCALPHDGEACVPWLAFALFDAQLNGLCVPSPFEPNVLTPYQFAQWDAAGRAVEGAAPLPAWRADVTLPAQATFAPVIDGYRCDESRAETRAVAGVTLHVMPAFPEDASRAPRYAFRVFESLLRVDGP